MKLERQFEARNGKLYKISTNEEFLPEKRTVKWSEVEAEAENYNESFLASLRNELKSLEEQGKFVVIDFVADKSCENAGEKTQFVEATKHTARRIKDCASVVGFFVPNDIDKNLFIGELLKKHNHYSFFTTDGWVQIAQ